MYGSLLERRQLDRRRFLRGAMGAAAAAGVASTLGPTTALAGGDGPRPLPAPEPIPGGLDLSGFGLLPPYDFIHVFGPGDPSVVLPFTGGQLQGFDVEPCSITDFKGTSAVAFHAGTAVGNDGRHYNLETDIRAFEGRYVDAHGKTHHGTFGFV